MPILQIESGNDPRLAPYRSLKATNATRWSDHFVVEGDKLVRRLLASDFPVDSLLVARQLLGAVDASVIDAVDVLVVPDSWIEAIVGFNFHRGMLACARRKPAVDLAAVCRAGHEHLTLAVCPNVQDPENLGALLRIGLAFGLDGLVLGPECADPLSRRVLRVSMGAALRVPIIEAAELEAALSALRAQGVHLWATVTDADAPAFDAVSRPKRIAVLFGSEGHGLAARWLAHCERAVTIPMRSGIDSLNVAVAAGIVLQHFSRQPAARA
jgi:tRNA G18 (ribose-2'-O)-methylase SpoU